MLRSTLHALRSSPWPAVAILLLLSLVAISTGWWRSTGVGPQVQVPMFYDDHYIYPRAWTQEQEAPGIPEPAPLAALYGPNRLSQPFTAGADRLSLIELWLAGPAGAEVEVSLAAENGPVYGGTIAVENGEGRFYRLAFPAISQSGGHRFILTLTAPEATAEQPVITQAVGGDRLGGSLLTNEYSRPGNLELYTYGRGLPGRWWLDSLAEQLLPAVFRLRLQQYKPAAFKGGAFAGLLAATALLTALFLIIVNGQWSIANSQLPIQNLKSKIQNYLGWSLAALLAAFLLWQVAAGRLLLLTTTRHIQLKSQVQPIALAPGGGGELRMVEDLVQTLWTAERKPEARFISTELVEGVPAVRVPADSSISYALTLPLDGRLRLGLMAAGSGSLRYSIWLGGQSLYEQRVAAGDSAAWIDLDLEAWAGQPGPLRLQTEAVEGQPDGLWLRPQLLTSAGWLLADPLPPDLAVQPAGHRYGDMVELAGYRVVQEEGQVMVDLYWRPLAATNSYATVFVHLLDSGGNIIAQHDSQPVSGTYPLPAWQPGVTIADRHVLTLPADAPAGPYQLAVGLYDPVTFGRWPVTGPDGEGLPDGRAVLGVPAESGVHPVEVVGADRPAVNRRAMELRRLKPACRVESVFRKHCSRRGDAFAV